MQLLSEIPNLTLQCARIVRQMEVWQRRRAVNKADELKADDLWMQTSFYMNKQSHSAVIQWWMSRRQDGFLR
jgi:hypothetical protein